VGRDAAIATIASAPAWVVVSIAKRVTGAVGGAWGAGTAGLPGFGRERQTGCRRCRYDGERWVRTGDQYRNRFARCRGITIEHGADAWDERVARAADAQGAAGTRRATGVAVGRPTPRTRGIGTDDIRRSTAVGGTATATRTREVGADEHGRTASGRGAFRRHLRTVGTVP
jgi:hypothetical protein